MIRLFGGDRMKRIADMFKLSEDEALQVRMLSRGIENAQKNLRAEISGQEKPYSNTTT